MSTFAMRGNDSKQVHASFSRTRLDYRGIFHMNGRQVVGVDDGAPQWVADVLEANPKIEEIAINYVNSGVIYTRIPTEMR